MKNLAVTALLLSLLTTGAGPAIAGEATGKVLRQFCSQFDPENPAIPKVCLKLK